MTKKERADLIRTLNTALVLYVPPENREPMAVMIADHMQMPFPDHFVKACLEN